MNKEIIETMEWRGPDGKLRQAQQIINVDSGEVVAFKLKGYAKDFQRKKE